LTDILCVTCNSIIHCSKVTSAYGGVHKVQMPLSGPCVGAGTLV
jgi:hypothetical protein